MVEVGSLEIVGRINVENIKAGLSDMRRGMDQAKESAKSTFADMERLGGSLDRVAKPAILLGGVLSGVFGGLAAMSPQLAPAISRMGTELFRLSNILGNVLQPTIEGLADSFGNFVDFVDQNPWAANMIGEVTKLAGILAVGGIAYKALKSFADLINGLPRQVKIGIAVAIAFDVGWNIGRSIGEATSEFGSNLFQGLGDLLDPLAGGKGQGSLALAYAIQQQITPITEFFDKIFGAGVQSMTGKNEMELDSQSYYMHANTG